MTHGDKETGSLQMHVRIDVNIRIATNFFLALCILLDGKLGNLGQIVGRIVFREIGHTTTKLYQQHLGNAEFQIEIRENIQVG